MRVARTLWRGMAFTTCPARLHLFANGIREDAAQGSNWPDFTTTRMASTGRLV